MSMNLNLSLTMFLTSCMMFSYFYKHLLLTLISMEFMMINLAITTYDMMMMLNMNTFFTTFFLSVSICEGVIGLSILVYMIRNSGNDYSNMLGLMKW